MRKRSYLTTSDVGRLLGMTVRQVCWLYRKGLLTPRRSRSIVGAFTRVSRADLAEYCRRVGRAVPAELEGKHGGSDAD